MKHSCFIACALVIVLLASGVSAQNYPSRPITVVVPLPPGGSTDAVARLTQEAMAAKLGQPIIIENKGGAGGTTGSAFVASAQPDGYTLLISVNSPLTMNQFTQKNFPFDSRLSFEPISILADTTLILAVNSSLPVTTVAELVTYAKRNPGKLSYGSAGLGSGHHIAGELIKRTAGIEMTHIPYRGGGPAIQDLVAGNIQVSFGSAPAVIPHAQNGSIRILGLVEEKRSPEMPGIPTVAETLPGVVTKTWLGFLAPKGTPPAIIEKLNDAALNAVRRQDVVEKMALLGLRPVGSTPSQLGQMIADDLEHWGKVFPSIGLYPE